MEDLIIKLERIHFCDEIALLCPLLVDCVKACVRVSMVVWELSVCNFCDEMPGT